jgi:hypothetical protein
MQNHDSRVCTRVHRCIYVSGFAPTGYAINTGGFATLDPKILVESYIQATAFARELRRLAVRFPSLLPEGARVAR